MQCYNTPVTPYRPSSHVRIFEGLNLDKLVANLSPTTDKQRLYYRDAICLCLHIIRNSPLHTKKDMKWAGYCSIPNCVFEALVTKRLWLLIKPLISGAGIIRVHLGYVAKNLSGADRKARGQGYKIHENWQNKPLVPYELSDRRLIRKWSPLKVKGRLTQIDRQHIEWLQQLQVDTMNIHDMPKNDMLKLVNLADGQITFSKSPNTLRRTTSLTLLPRYLRPRITSNGEPLAFVDISNCHLLSLAHLAMDWATGEQRFAYASRFAQKAFLAIANLDNSNVVQKRGSLEKIRQFLCICELGNIPSELFRLLGNVSWKKRTKKGKIITVTVANPGDLKPHILAWLNMSTKTIYYRDHPITKMMREHFEPLVTLIELLKAWAQSRGMKRPHRIMSHLLGKAESSLVDIMVKGVREHLGRRVNAHNFHDAIVTEERISGHVMELAREACAKKGIVAHLKMDRKE